MRPFVAVVSLGIRFALTGLALGACSSVPPASSPVALSKLRSAGRSSSDGDLVGRWLIAEMIAPGGDAKGAADAEKRLAETDANDHKKTIAPTMYGELAIGMAKEAHGSPGAAAASYLTALEIARVSHDETTPLVAWFAAHHLLSLRTSVADLYAHNRPRIEKLLVAPGNLGWRAEAELLEWSTAEAFDKAEVVGDAYDALVATNMGCAKSARIAGPFGHGSAADRRRSFAPEKAGPWATSWPADPLRANRPHILKTEQHRCQVVTTESVDEGVFYTETFVTVNADRDVIVAVQGAVKTWVDDAPVVERDLRQWGVWQRFGATVHLTKGRHRIVARLLGDSTSVRILNVDGTAAHLDADIDDARPYAIDPPRIVGNPNPIDAMVVAQTTADSAEAKEPLSPIVAFLAAYAAHVEAMDDVASVLLLPLTEPTDAAPMALELAATAARGDSALPEEMRRRVERDLHGRSIAKDPKLWYASAWIDLDTAEQKGLLDGIEPLRKLADEFREEPEILEQLARLYAQLGWKSERMHALADLSKRFPDDVNALRLYMTALEADGPLAEADAVAARVKKLDPDAEIDVDRAIARNDWKGAIDELKRLGKRRPDRKDIATRIAGVLERAGDPSAAVAQLEKALAKNPEDSAIRLRIADRALAKGDTSALRRALADSLQAGGKGAEIRAALDLLDGATSLEPYRVDGRRTIREFEAWEKSTGKHMEGNAARVLDYSAIWVHPDGSSEMLEHEILRMQSQEAIGEQSEQKPPEGLVLHIRVIKPDGSILEPEPVSGKPTLTMPNLEVGDYLEIEHITDQAGDGQKGLRYEGPTWFFREADKGYWRSEFVCITPKEKPLEIETRGKVAPPKVREMPTFLERKWRIDESPPAVLEPDSPPITEFLPSVRIGWGISLNDTLARLLDAAVDETPLDPRLTKRALEIVRGVPPEQTEERARLLYKDVVLHIEDGQENDGRRALMGKSGSRQAAFEHLMRQLHIPLDVAVVKNRLAAPPIGKMSEVEEYDSLVMRAKTDRGTRWLTVHDKFAPFGYVPAEYRGEEAIVLVPGLPREKTEASGSTDGIVFEGRADMKPDGSATVDLAQSFTGKIGISLRGVLDKVPEAQMHDFIESRLLTRNLPGGRLRDLKIENKDELSLPLVVKMHADVRELARPLTQGLSIKALFPLHLSQLATLPSRQTPLLLGTSSHVEARFTIVMPESMRMPASVPTANVRDGERVVIVRDVVQGHAIVIDRLVDIPAGRVQPGEEYARFQQFTQDGDAAVEREILVGK